MHILRLNILDVAIINRYFFTLVRYYKSVEIILIGCVSAVILILDIKYNGNSACGDKIVDPYEVFLLNNYDNFAWDEDMGQYANGYDIIRRPLVSPEPDDGNTTAERAAYHCATADKALATPQDPVHPTAHKSSPLATEPSLDTEAVIRNNIEQQYKIVKRHLVDTEWSVPQPININKQIFDHTTSIVQRIENILILQQEANADNLTQQLAVYDMIKNDPYYRLHGASAQHKIKMLNILHQIISISETPPNMRISCYYYSAILSLGDDPQSLDTFIHHPIYFQRVVELLAEKYDKKK